MSATRSERAGHRALGAALALAMAGCGASERSVGVEEESAVATQTVDADGTSFDGAFTLAVTARGKSVTNVWLYDLTLTAGDMYGPFSAVDSAPAITVHRDFPIALAPGQEVRVEIQFTARVPAPFLADFYQPSFFLEGSVYSSSSDDFSSFGGNHATPIVSP